MWCFLFLDCSYSPSGLVTNAGRSGVVIYLGGHSRTWVLGNCNFSQCYLTIHNYCPNIHYFSPCTSESFYTKGTMNSSMMLEIHIEHVFSAPIGVPESVSKCALFTYLAPAACNANADIPATFINLPGYLLLLFWYGGSFSLSSLFFLSNFLCVSCLVSHPCTF